MQNLPSIYELSSGFIKHLFRIQIQQGRKVLFWNQVKSGMEACHSEIILAAKFKHNLPPQKFEKAIIVLILSGLVEKFSAKLKCIIYNIERTYLTILFTAVVILKSCWIGSILKSCAVHCYR